MRRMTTTNKDVSREMICRNEGCGVTEEHCPHLMEDECACLREVINRLAKYEDAEEQCIAENQCGIGELLVKWKAFFDDIKELYDYRKAEEQGLLRRFPVSVGRKIYCPVHSVADVVLEFTIVKIEIYEEELLFEDESENVWKEGDFGKMVFLTREEAESALAEKGE